MPVKYIPYNPASDPWQHLAQGLNFSITGLTEGLEKRRAAEDMSRLREFITGTPRTDRRSMSSFYPEQAAGPMEGTLPRMKSRIGQQILSELTLRQGLNSIVDPVERQMQLARINALNQQGQASSALARQRDVLTEPQRRLTESAAAENEAQAEYYRQGRTKTPLSATALSGQAKLMDSFIDKAKKTRIGKKNFSQGDLIQAWNDYKEAAGYANLDEGQREQLWSTWNNKLIQRAGRWLGEYEWDPNSEQVKAAGPAGAENQQPGLYDEVRGYLSQMDEESADEFRQIVASGNPAAITEALNRLRAKYGASR